MGHTNQFSHPFRIVTSFCSSPGAHRHGVKAFRFRFRGLWHLSWSWPRFLGGGETDGSLNWPRFTVNQTLQRYGQFEGFLTLNSVFIAGPGWWFPLFFLIFSPNLGEWI